MLFQASRGDPRPVRQFLDLYITRENLLHNVLTQVSRCPLEWLKLPLVVHLSSNGVPEEGVDQGGVTKVSPLMTSDQSLIWLHHPRLGAAGQCYSVLCFEPTFDKHSCTSWCQQVFAPRSKTHLHSQMAICAKTTRPLHRKLSPPHQMSILSTRFRHIFRFVSR